MRTTTPVVLSQVAAERERQDAKWGPQNHADGTNLKNDGWRDHARSQCQRAALEGRMTWAHILQEEFTEALAETDPVKLRTELIQVAAVAVAWAEAIDRRSATCPAHGEHPHGGATCLDCPVCRPAPEAG